MELSEYVKSYDLLDRWRSSWVNPLKVAKELFRLDGVSPSSKVYEKKDNLWVEINEPAPHVRLLDFCLVKNVTPVTLKACVWFYKGNECLYSEFIKRRIRLNDLSLKIYGGRKPRQTWRLALDESGVEVIGAEVIVTEPIFLTAPDGGDNVLTQLIKELYSAICAQVSLGDDEDGVDNLYADEIANELFVEGERKSVQVDVYERSEAARKACLAKRGLSCTCCGMNFEKLYGAAGKGVIHVHHLTPVASMGHAYIIDPESDLVPVCANCHVIIHRKEPPYTPEEVAVMLERKI